VRTIRVTIERSWTRQRVWLKAVDSNGTVEIVQNIPAMDVVRLRNELLEKLTASGVYDEVTGDAIKAFPDKAIPGTVKNNEDPNDPFKRKRRQRSFGRLHGGKPPTT
jgi:hypothetical protein